jgi:hypothetical protein
VRAKGSFTVPSAGTLGEVPFRKKKNLIIRHILDRHLEGFENHEQARDAIFEMRADSLVKSHELDVRGSSRHAEPSDKGGNRSRRDAASPQCNESVQPGIIPPKNVALLN